MLTTVRANKSPSLNLCFSLPSSLCSSFSVYATSLISVSVDDYPNAIINNYTSCCACVCLHVCMCTFSPIRNDALISLQLSCCPTASHTDKQKATLPDFQTHTQDLLFTHYALRILIAVTVTTAG